MGRHSADVSAWHEVPAPREDLIPELPVTVRATSADAGVWVDGARGWHAPVMAVTIAIARGWPITADDRVVYTWASRGMPDGDHNYDESWSEIVDDATDWLTDAVAPDGYSFGWHEGSLMLWSDADWCAASGDQCMDATHDHS